MCLPNAKHVFKVEKEWEHAGLQCAVVQGSKNRNRCGYVRVPPGHKLHGLGYSEIEIDLDVHGGLTFANLEPCAHDDGVGWWFGFDCAHCDDAFWDPNNLPEHEIEFRKANPESEDMYDREHFWLHEEVVVETERLAEQLTKIF